MRSVPVEVNGSVGVSVDATASELTDPTFDSSTASDACSTDNDPVLYAHIPVLEQGITAKDACEHCDSWDISRLLVGCRGSLLNVRCPQEASRILLATERAFRLSSSEKQGSAKLLLFAALSHGGWTVQRALEGADPYGGQLVRVVRISGVEITDRNACRRGANDSCTRELEQHGANERAAVSKNVDANVDDGPLLD